MRGGARSLFAATLLASIVPVILLGLVDSYPMLLVCGFAIPFDRFHAIPRGALAVFTVVAAIGFALIFADARRLNLLALGEDAAQELGVNAVAVKRRLFAGAALLVSAVVAFAGPIGFVGLIVPHAARMLLGPDNRLLLPAVALGGGVFLLIADTLARNVVAPAELSVGVLTSFCGAPFFVYLLRTRATLAAP